MGNRKAKWQHAKHGEKHNAFSGLLATKIHFWESQKTTKYLSTLCKFIKSTICQHLRKKVKVFSALESVFEKAQASKFEKGQFFLNSLQKAFHCSSEL